MEIAEHIAALRREGELLAAAAEDGALAATVPSCPDWTVADVVRHVGGVHRWAASFVTLGRAEATTVEEDAVFFAAPADADLLEWYRAAHADLVVALSTADPAVQCLSFLPAPTPLAFWARRQAHETAIHRVDVQLVSGSPTEVPPDFAVDGIEELLRCFYGPGRGRKLVADPPRTIGIRPTDVDRAWTVRLEPTGRSVTDGAGAADLTLSGTVHELYLFLWNRAGEERVDVNGDRGVLDLWRERARIRWA